MKISDRLRINNEKISSLITTIESQKEEIEKLQRELIDADGRIERARLALEGEK